MKNSHKSIINFAYFTANFPHNFIEKCWEDKHMAAHIRAKLNNKAVNNFVDMGAFMKFFMDLDSENMQILLGWIEENYLAFDHLKLTTL